MFDIAEGRFDIRSTLLAQGNALLGERVGFGLLTVFSQVGQVAAGWQTIVAIGGSDAHTWPQSLGPLKRVIFPCEFHFKTVNTHLFTSEPLTGDSAADRRLVYEAFENGR